ncbi:MAG: ATP phosphoribosyltransferase [Alphaproteobacteria bacterium]|nr:ATP phosphoribosyltransferase [Alphaproteobacteria bacterium]
MAANTPPAEKYLAVTIRDKIIIALPKGRVLEAGIEMLGAVGILPEYAFFDKESRQLRFSTNRSDVDLIRVRSFDVATFVAFGAAHMGIAGSDVLLEYEYAELYAPLDLGIGRCRLVVAEPEAVEAIDDPRRWSHVRVATKYPNLTRRHFATRGVQAECVKLHGAMELAPALGLCRRIVDLVETGSTLRANGLVEVETIAEVSSRLVVNRVALKTRPVEIGALVENFNEVARGNTT